MHSIKTWFRPFCLSAALVLPGCLFIDNLWAAPLAFDPSHPIYDISKTPHTVDEFDSVLEKAYAKGKPVVIYLHGRGKEPEKSFNPSMTGGGGIFRLSEEYDTSVILVNWNSRAKNAKDRSLPLKHVPQGAQTMAAVLKKLSAFEEKHPTLAKPSLLVHSMGSIVLAETVKNIGWPAQPHQPLFTNILMSEPDVDSQGHAIWLSKISALEKVYVTQNKLDFILRHSKNSRAKGHFALGREPVPPFAPGANYVNLTDVIRVKHPLKRGDHQIFRKSSMEHNVGVCVFVTKALRGEAFDVDTLPSTITTSPGHFKIKPRVDVNSDCFDNSARGDDVE